MCLLTLLLLELCAWKTNMVFINSKDPKGDLQNMTELNKYHFIMAPDTQM